MTENDLEVQYPAKSQFIEVIDEWIDQKLEKVGCKDKKFFFAIHEAIINSIEATQRIYGEEHDKTIKISIILKKESIQIMIRDSALGLRKDLKNRLEENNFNDIIWEDRGRGMLFIRKFVDEFIHYIDANGEAVYVLRKGGLQNARK